MRKETIGNHMLFCADALDILPLIKGRANLFLSDIPYKLIAGGRSKNDKGTMSGIFHGDNYNNNGSIIECDITFDDMAQPIFNALADNADAYVMTNDKNQFDAQRAFMDAGFKFHNLLTWDKGTMTPNRWYMKNQEYILYLWKGHARVINNASSKQSVTLPVKKVTAHPTEKPVSLMKHYIKNSTNIGDWVLDPFMGTGATGVASVETGRNFIGIEIDPQWFEIACERIHKANEHFKYYGPDMDFFNTETLSQHQSAMAI